jgi:hypothetical protein
MDREQTYRQGWRGYFGREEIWQVWRDAYGLASAR